MKNTRTQKNRRWPFVPISRQTHVDFKEASSKQLLKAGEHLLNEASKQLWRDQGPKRQRRVQRLRRTALSLAQQSALCSLAANALGKRKTAGELTLNEYEEIREKSWEAGAHLIFSVKRPEEKEEAKAAA